MYKKYIHYIFFFHSFSTQILLTAQMSDETDSLLLLANLPIRNGIQMTQYNLSIQNVDTTGRINEIRISINR